MFKRLQAMSMLVLLAMFGQMAYANGLVKIYPQSVMLGERVTLVLNGNQALRDFDQLDLTALKQQFAIHEIDASSDQIRLRLYPLKAGLLTLPETRAGAIHIPSTAIQVNPNPEVDIRWQPPQTEAYLGQNLLWKVTVALKNSANQSSFEARENDNWQSQLQAQAVAEETNRSGSSITKTEQFVGSYQFVASELTQNNRLQTLHSPAVVVKNTTSRRWRFFDAPRTVKILPLPQFLPMNMTVGKVRLKTSTDGVLKVAGDLNYWVWQLEGKGVDRFALDNLVHQLIGQMAHSEKLEWLSESRESTSELTTEGVKSRLTVRLPYRALQAGLVSLPELNVRYFDTETGKLVSTNLPADVLVSMPAWLVWLGQWFLLIVVLGGGYGLLWQIKQAWLNHRLRKAMLHAKDAETLINLMFDWQQQQTPIWKPNQPRLRATSLQEFERLEPQSEALTNLIQSLNQLSYAQAGSKPTWFEVQKQAKPWINSLALFRWRLK